MTSHGMILESFLSLLLSYPAMAVHAGLLVCALIMVFRRGNRPDHLAVHRLRLPHPAVKIPP